MHSKSHVKHEILHKRKFGIIDLFETNMSSNWFKEFGEGLDLRLKRREFHCVGKQFTRAKSLIDGIALPLQSVLFPDHLPDASHVLIEDPESLYPCLHIYLTVPPKVKTLPLLLPLEGVPGSPQSTIKQVPVIKNNICNFFSILKAANKGHMQI